MFVFNTLFFHALQNAKKLRLVYQSFFFKTKAIKRSIEIANFDKIGMGSLQINDVVKKGRGLTYLSFGKRLTQQKADPVYCLFF